MLLVIVPLYGAFASRVNRTQLVQSVTLFFAGNLVLFGQYTTEFWAPNATTTFARQGGAALDWGLVARQSVKRTSIGTLFLGQNRDGNTKVLRLSGYSVVPVSTPEIEFVLQSLPLTAAVAQAYTKNGHTFYRLSIANKTLEYDCTSNTWNYNTTGVAGDRGIAQYGALVGGQYYVSDYRNNRIYRVRPDVYTDGSETIVREAITRHIFADYDQITVAAVFLDFETGVGLTSG